MLAVHGTSSTFARAVFAARADFGAPGSTTRVFVVGGAAPAFRLSGHAKI